MDGNRLTPIRVCVRLRPLVQGDAPAGIELAGGLTADAPPCVVVQPPSGTKRGGARNALAAVISSAQIANMIFVFCNLARVALQSAPPGHHLTKAEVGSLLASPPRGQYESVVTVHEAAFAIYGFFEKPRLEYVSRARSRAGFNMHPEGASKCSGNHTALLRFTSQGSAFTRESMLASV